MKAGQRDEIVSEIDAPRILSGFSGNGLIIRELHVIKISFAAARTRVVGVLTRGKAGQNRSNTQSVYSDQS
jgi:hypothetical protein